MRNTFILITPITEEERDRLGAPETLLSMIEIDRAIGEHRIACLKRGDPVPTEEDLHEQLFGGD